MKILVLNSGSSSQKSCVYEVGDALPAHPPDPLWQGKIQWKDGVAEIRLRNSQGAELKESLKLASHTAATERLLDMLDSGARAASRPGRNEDPTAESRSGQFDTARSPRLRLVEPSVGAA